MSSSTPPDMVSDLLSMRGLQTGPEVGVNSAPTRYLYILDAPITVPTAVRLNALWVLALEDPNPPPVVVELLVQLTASAFYSNPLDLVSSTEAMLGPGSTVIPVVLPALASVGIARMPQTERQINQYFQQLSAQVTNTRGFGAAIADDGTLSVWQVMLIHLVLVSGHLFTGNPQTGSWYAKRRPGLNLNTNVTFVLSSDFLRILGMPGTSLPVNRAVIAAVAFDGMSSSAIGIPLVAGISRASQYVVFAGQAWLFLALKLIWEARHPILLLPSVRNEMEQLLQAIAQLGPNRFRLPFQRILVSAVADSFQAGRYPQLSSAAYGAARALFTSFTGFRGVAFSAIIEKTAFFLSQALNMVDPTKVDPITGLSGDQLQLATERVNQAITAASSQGEGTSFPAV
ncbi:putative nucleoprotein [Oberland virus]|uniref:Nucleoprotein n=1 Tax=Oberland virus TaxID=2675849 RepID=A0A974MWQ4_9MONO|nr:putative nucleoprotein [Oberland virus]QOI11494.1 putative nucleoprotein [Oberland virus]